MVGVLPGAVTRVTGEVCGGEVGTAWRDVGVCRVSQTKMTTPYLTIPTPGINRGVTPRVVDGILFVSVVSDFLYVH